ncbi:ArdC family protein [Caulobacter sp. RL271]|uniref:Zincin-like metallopeptidase domain-containing protein n=1 Tax=Caulobacter segnis TaxID=88688 RepID=A0ABY4ZRN5_9CAUL|nr:zincin-like metallopeptidase domain-containing protein [Caulobacter segnis]USQ95263.1 zincin-like metallopeptidase domain-containing protein [Caulobacter segnis]
MRPSASSRRSAAKAAPAQPPEVSLYDEVTRKIITQLEAGRFPWVQPWGRAKGAALALPRNGVTGRRYSGINILLLWGAVFEHGYPSQAWVTFRQALAAGGAVRRGEHGATVVFADRFTPKAEQERAARDGDEPGKVAFLKRFKVFNLAQCEGLGGEGLEGLDGEAAPLPERQVVPAAEALITATGADFRIGGQKAFYVPSLDYVQVPPQPAFTDQINYYRTAFHELSHWTGHPSRLGRDQSGPYGGKAYGREELVAEMGAAFVCATLGITPTVRHADYLGAWLETLREDNRAIFRAASQASKAADLLLSFQSDPEPPPPPAGAVARVAEPLAAPLAA